jgi:lipoprotein-releasing system ATP-binding protein
MSEPLLVARELAKSYRSGPRRVEVLRGLDLEIEAGETVAVVGESGVGKSTLLHLLGGLDRPDSGRLTFGGLDLLAADTRERAAYRNGHVGFVFQMHHLLPELTAEENVEMPFRIGRRGIGDGEPRRLLERLGLAERLGHTPAELSGGEQQRVAVARAVVAGPRLVLADEPTGNLDPQTGRVVFDMLREQQRERGFALVLATHNERLASGCDRVLRLGDGQVRPLGAEEARRYFSGTSI